MFKGTIKYIWIISNKMNDQDNEIVGQNIKKSLINENSDSFLDIIKELMKRDVEIKFSLEPDPKNYNEVYQNK